ncbi:50S ribosomal protein L6 [Candidatus Peregrinibacteria bacterium]|nr:MAG: 50S ribosomal protein L6 [Candidatus Peregrinibacteria bacterium]
MSRIGKQPVVIPNGVEVSITGDIIAVKGKKGELTFSHHSHVSVSMEEGMLQVVRKSDEKEDRALHGLTRALIQNMVTGVNEGFSIRLEIIGVGYRTQVSDSKITLSLGFSHPVEMITPEGITAEIDKDTKQLVLSGIDKQKVGQFAAEIRSLRKPEPYKGKGIRYAGEHVRRKVGKAAGKK